MIQTILGGKDWVESRDLFRDRIADWVQVAADQRLAPDEVRGLGFQRHGKADPGLEGVGLGFAVPLKSKSDDFIGKAALIQRKEHPRRNIWLCAVRFTSRLKISKR